MNVLGGYLCSGPFSRCCFALCRYANLAGGFAFRPLRWFFGLVVCLLLSMPLIQPADCTANKRSCFDYDLYLIGLLLLQRTEPSSCIGRGRALSAWLETPFTSSDRVKAGWLHKDKLNSGCCVRVGEAANPAPGRSSKATWQRDTLESTPLLLPVTIALEERRLLQAFLSWCQTEVRAIALEELFNKVPEGLALLL
jgi:hypothetical protein